MDLTHYVDVEVNSVTREIIDGRDCFEMCEPNDPDLHCWGIYLRHTDGHAMHVADCPTKETADTVAQALKTVL